MRGAPPPPPPRAPQRPLLPRPRPAEEPRTPPGGSGRLPSTASPLRATLVGRGRLRTPRARNDRDGRRRRGSSAGTGGGRGRRVPRAPRLHLLDTSPVTLSTGGEAALAAASPVKSTGTRSRATPTPHRPAAPPPPGARRPPPRRPAAPPGAAEAPPLTRQHRPPRAPPAARRGGAGLPSTSWRAGREEGRGAGRARPPACRRSVRALSPPPPAEPRPRGREAGAEGRQGSGWRRQAAGDSGSPVLAAHSPMPGSPGRGATALSCRGTAGASSLGVFLKQPSHRERLW